MTHSAMRFRNELEAQPHILNSGQHSEVVPNASGIEDFRERETETPFIIHFDEPRFPEGRSEINRLSRTDCGGKRTDISSQQSPASNLPPSSSKVAEATSQDTMHSEHSDAKKELIRGIKMYKRLSSDIYKPSITKDCPFATLSEIWRVNLENYWPVFRWSSAFECLSKAKAHVEHPGVVTASMFNCIDAKMIEECDMTQGKQIFLNLLFYHHSYIIHGGDNSNQAIFNPSMWMVQTKAVADFLWAFIIKGNWSLYLASKSFKPSVMLQDKIKEYIHDPVPELGLIMGAALAECSAVLQPEGTKISFQKDLAQNLERPHESWTPSFTSSPQHQTSTHKIDTNGASQGGISDGRYEDVTYSEELSLHMLGFNQPIKNAVLQSLSSKKIAMNAAQHPRKSSTSSNQHQPSMPKVGANLSSQGGFSNGKYTHSSYSEELSHHMQGFNQPPDHAVPQTEQSPQRFPHETPLKRSRFSQEKLEHSDAEKELIRGIKMYKRLSSDIYKSPFFIVQTSPDIGVIEIPSIPEECTFATLSDIWYANFKNCWHLSRWKFAFDCLSKAKFHVEHPGVVAASMFNCIDTKMIEEFDMTQGTQKFLNLLFYHHSYIIHGGDNSNQAIFNPSMWRVQTKAVADFLWAFIINGNWSLYLTSESFKPSVMLQDKIKEYIHDPVPEHGLIIGAALAESSAVLQPEGTKISFQKDLAQNLEMPHESWTPSFASSPQHQTSTHKTDTNVSSQGGISFRKYQHATSSAEPSLHMLGFSQPIKNAVPQSQTFEKTAMDAAQHPKKSFTSSNQDQPSMPEIDGNFSSQEGFSDREYTHSIYSKEPSHYMQGFNHPPNNAVLQSISSDSIATKTAQHPRKSLGPDGAVNDEADSSGLNTSNANAVHFNKGWPDQVLDHRSKIM
ncbi:hypothetical protein CROQUDRAFT_132009 [Cronartium quercuum f. sp. fusiforme G11]|uniref:Uncharacterized protein n=1 Tax=Cronartium quercuum f. sp. fusiforme G11 TaxID=708437 RepID=A0A9P6NJU1_9BASI|nr:hypothetical protein CROQUDRAFT_132009 [Cronartium quercuum f. sp. fusiforme G11]